MPGFRRICRSTLVGSLSLVWACQGEQASEAALSQEPASALNFDEAGSQRKADPAAVYRKAMMELADAIVQRTRQAAEADYDSFEQAQAAMQSCLPQASLPKLDEVLAAEGVQEETMLQYMKAHPAEVEAVGAAFEKRLAEVEPDLARLIAKVAALAPEGQRERVEAQLRRIGYGHLLESPQWRQVDDIEALQAAFALARAQNKGVFLDVRADWCVPCRELENETLADSSVMPLLRERFVAVRLDVTDPDEGAAALQASVGGQQLPLLAIWDAQVVRTGSPSLRSMPEPSRRITVFVEPDELVRVLSDQGEADAGM